jgi:hypothetical protein
MNKKSGKPLLVGTVIAALSFLPGCFDNSNKNEEPMPTETAAAVPLTGEILVTMKGQPVISSDMVETYKEKFFATNPQMKSLVLSSGGMKQLEHDVMESLIANKVVTEYINAHKINETAEYKSRLQDIYDNARTVVDIEFFRSKFAPTVSDSEVRAFYDANKDKVQGIKLSAGGVAATGIEFTDGAAARAFAARAKSAPGGFKKVAQDDVLTPKIRDFKLVNNQSIGIEAPLRDKIASLKTVPSVETFEVDGKFWVVNATSKEEAKYVPYEQCKNDLKQYLENNKLAEVMGKTIEDLKKEYNVEVNEGYFGQEDNQQVAMTAPAPAAAERKDVDDQRLA